MEQRFDAEKVRSPLLAIVPALNEERHVSRVVACAREFVDEVLVVDDGSTDATVERALAAGAWVVRHSHNRGKSVALQTGFDYALKRGFPLVVTLDGDGQHDPEEIPELLDVWFANGAHIVAGNRMESAADMPVERRFVNGLSSKIATWLARQDLPDCHCGYRLIDAQVLRQVRLRSPQFAGDPELLLWASFRSFKVVSAPIRCIYADERSHINPLVHGIQMIVLALRAFGERLRVGRRE